jgi:hypothetical protein
MNLLQSSVLFAMWEVSDNTTQEQIINDGLLRLSKNEENAIVSMKLMQTITERNDNSFMQDVDRVAFINGDLEYMQNLIKKYKIKVGTDHNSLFGEHKIVIHEMLESEIAKLYPDDEHDGGYTEKIRPDTNEVLTKDGVAIYRKTLLVHESKDQSDILIAHDRDIAPKVAKDSKADFKAEEEPKEEPKAKK